MLPRSLGPEACEARGEGHLPIDLDLTGRTAFVSGSTQGIGLAIAQRLALAGARVAVNGRSSQRVQEALDALVGAGVEPSLLVAAPGDVTAEDGLAAALEADDRADVAAAARARGAHVHGVHLGQDDLPVPDACALLGHDAVIGLTTGTLDLVRDSAGVAFDLDYLGAGPFRRTPTKDSGREPLGVEGYPALVRATMLPIVAIGDVTPADAPALSRTGVAGVALVRAVMEAVGISNIRSKCLRSNNPQNVVKACMQGLMSLRGPEEVARIRGKRVEEIVG